MGLVVGMRRRRRSMAMLGVVVGMRRRVSVVTISRDLSMVVIVVTICGC